MRLKTNIAASWAAHFVTLLVGFFLVPFVLGRLGDEGYGVWVFVNSVAGYSGLLYLGFGPTVCRFVADSRARGEWGRVNQIVSSIVAVYTAAGVVVMLLTGGCAACAGLIDKWGSTPLLDVRLAILCLGLNMALGMVGSVYGGVLHAAQRFDLHSLVLGLTALVRLGLTVAFLRQEHGLLVLAGIFLVITVLENAGMAVLAHREAPTLSIRPRFIDRGTMQACFSFSAYNALRWVSVRLIHLTDTVVIGFVLGAKAIVPYYIGMRLVQMIHAPLEKIADVVLPSAGELHARGEREQLHDLLIKGMSLGMLLAGGLWVGAAYFGERLITTWMGSTTPETQTVLLILLGAQIVGQPMIVLRQVLLAMGKVRLPALLDLGQAFVNLVLSLVMIRVMGIVGVAWGTLAPMLLIELGLLAPYGLRALQLPIREALWRTVAPVCLPLAALWAYCEYVSRFELPDGWGAILAVTTGGGAVLGMCRVIVELMQRRSSFSRELREAMISTEEPVCR